jgi:tol-pal system protein YbgF
MFLPSVQPIVARLVMLAGGMIVAAAAHAQQPAQQNRGVIELMNQIEALNTDLNRLRGQIEVLNNSLENAQRRQRDMYLDLDTRLRRIEGGGDASQKSAAELDARIKKLEQQLSDLDARAKQPEAAAAPTQPAAAAAPSTAAAVAQPSPPAAPSVARPEAPTPAVAAADAGSPRRAYDNALALYRAGDYQGAIGAFDAFVKRNPRDALAANAQYWIGDAWFNLRDFRAALSAQQALIATYPDSPKVPDAMLNVSSSQIALGDSAAAKKTLEELVSRFPQTDAAEKGRQRLARMR